ncbi:porin [Snodgrassella sp. CFCC 13594]|uniref:porin n=1 Tax=Snodgrassella sp. CFCC 13594 TaxID=1775559 RepID=UPI0009EF1E47|nr:porin [Snodgrassella sp. CFCC 13594]
MKKTLIALALTTLPVAAMAEVVLYGQIKAGYEATSSKVSDVNVGGQEFNFDRSPYTNGIADYGSRIGFKGNEDLGNGLKAIWQVESKTNLAGGGTSGNTFATRDSFIGLQGNFGTVKAGYLSNYINANMDDVDAWEYGNDALGLGKFTRTDARYAGVGYESPEWAGFSFGLLFSPRDNVNGGDRNAEYDVGTGDGAKYSAGLTYQNSGFYAKYGFDYLKNSAARIYEDGSAELKDGQVHRLEGGYDANNLFVGAGFQFTKNTSSYNRAVNAVSDSVTVNGESATVGSHTVGIDNSGKEAALTVGYHFGNVFPKLTYAHGWNVKANGEKFDNTKYDQVILGADYSFSKRTTANVQAGWLSEGNGRVGDVDLGKTKTTSFGVGLKHVF